MLASGFEWDDAVTWEDVRRSYGESRMVAIGYIGRRLYVVVYLDRDGSRRVISLRKANKQEVDFYAQT
ncbi:BrnT family toxin [Pusillimonas sp.]|uniref:BrnT family toxin n=1 Tax=Pusillimonas sp. TaxID=3040095 RepID=UPI0029B3FF4D|nr:BrnT family toxin [Pusillimonas sp.]MDX3895053.1 BrnT family toxin [Pusillimonas sp.]